MSEKNNYEKPLTVRRFDKLFQETMNECDLDKARTEIQ